MAQNASQIPITPPLPGLQLVQDINKAIETIASDFAGSFDPAAIAWPFAVWADTGTQTIKRRNATNDAWVIEGSLLQRHLIALTLAQITALTADQGPIVCQDNGAIYAWSGTAYAQMSPALSGGVAANFAVMPWLNGLPIIGFGNNGNGSWIKYAGGVVVCYIKINAWSPAPGVSGRYTPTLPIAMIASSAVVLVSKGDGTNNYNYYATAAMATTGLSLSVFINSSDTAARLQDFHFIIIGKAA